MLFVKALSNPTRLEIIKLLEKGSRNVSEICSHLGFEQSRVSHNLRCLIDCGFVEAEQNGKSRVYSLNKDTIVPLLKIINQHIEKYQRHLIDCKILDEGHVEVNV